MATLAQHTKADKVLLALAAMAGAAADGPGVTKFHAVVRAWESDRAAFGLPGFKDAHPHSNAVIVILVLLERSGFVTRTGVSRYRLTRAGQRRAEQLAAVAGAA